MIDRIIVQTYPASRYFGVRTEAEPAEPVAAGTCGAKEMGNLASRQAFLLKKKKKRKEKSCLIQIM